MTTLTTANQVTLLRMLLIPVFVILVLYDSPGWALLVFLLAGITDGLDGLIARLTRQKTSLGAFLDPMADKLLLVTTFVVLTLPAGITGLVNRFPLWLTVLIISRDVGIVLTVAIVNLVVGQRTFQPSMYGKIATGTYVVTVVVVMFFNYLRRSSVIVDVGIYVCLAITLISGLHYVAHARRIINRPG
jgi:cardiolipin synthase (CMP-forming)